MGRIKTFMLMAALTALLMIIGQLVGGNQGMIMAFVFAGAANFFAYWNSDKMVLAKTNAKEINADSAPALFNMVRDLAANADIPMPKIYIVSSPQPNAFATGRDPNHAAIAVNTGLMDVLTQDELAGVIAHEMAHIKYRDTLTMTVTATMAGALTMIARWAMFFGSNRDNRSGGGGAIAAILSMILAPIAAALIQFAVSRTREYEADKHGAEICGHPLWLAGALEKIGLQSDRIVNEYAERNPEIASLFIVNPLMGGKRDNLFATHPALENRIQRLHQMAKNEMNINKSPMSQHSQQKQTRQRVNDKDLTAPGNESPW